MLIPTDKDKQDSIDRKYNKKLDWFISAQSKLNILEVFFILKDILAANSEKELAQSEFEEKLSTLGEINPDFAQELNNWDWKKKKTIVKAMWRKYEKDKKANKMKKFENYIELPRAYWTLQLDR